MARSQSSAGYKEPGKSLAAPGVQFRVHSVEARVQYNRLSIGCKAQGSIVFFGELGQSWGRSRYQRRLCPLHSIHSVNSELLRSTRAFRLTDVTVEDASVRLQPTATAPRACCPCAAVSSSSLDSRSQHRLTDLLWGACAVHLQLTVRKFVGCQPTCAHRIFTERLPDLVEPFTRKTTHLITVLWAISIALGGQAGPASDHHRSVSRSQRVLRRRHSTGSA